ncbi:MAG: hypothetical protein GXO64_05135 [Candidatus Micrarchaeota archaeon]|nr:hypothetical protein [Candidatus Micrarchaeota archaeon]
MNESDNFGTYTMKGHLSNKWWMKALNKVLNPFGYEAVRNYFEDNNGGLTSRVLAKNGILGPRIPKFVVLQADDVIREEDGEDLSVSFKLTGDGVLVRGALASQYKTAKKLDRFISTGRGNGVYIPLALRRIPIDPKDCYDTQDGYVAATVPGNNEKYRIIFLPKKYGPEVRMAKRNGSDVFVKVYKGPSGDIYGKGVNAVKGELKKLRSN